MAPRSPKTDFSESTDTMKDVLPRWDLTKIYPSYDSPEFKADFDKLIRLIDNFVANYEGKIATKNNAGKVKVHCDTQTLAQSFIDDQEIDHLEGRLSTYLQLKTVQDSEAFGADETAFETKYAEHYSKRTFYTHELKAIPENKLKTLVAGNATLEKFGPVIDQVRRGIPHTKPLDAQRYAAELNPRNDWIKAFDQRALDLRFPFEGEELNEIGITHIMYNDPDAQRRAAAHDVFQQVYKDNAWFYTTVHNALMRLKNVDDRWSKFENAWDSRHFANGIDGTIVDAMETAIKSAYPDTSHRFYALKAQLMGQDKLLISDRNANPFDGQTEEKISWSEAKKLVLEAFSSFSQEQADIAEMFFDNGWIDAAPAPNKQNGAFAHPGMAHTDHPVVMLNYEGSPRDVMTLAHELGHGVHQYLEAQNKAVLHAPLTLAETASVFGEMLTFELLLKRTKSDEEKRKMLFEKLNDMINTNIRQISFYDFEKRINTQYKEEEKPLKTEDYARHWLEALSESYGDAIPLDEEYGMTFGFIPHLVHTPFYVYAYAFGDSLVNALYQVYDQSIIPEQDFKEKYRSMLAAGGEYKAEKLKDDFGLDVSDPAFWSKGLDMISGMIDELEKLSTPVLENKAAPASAPNTPEA